MMGPTIPDFTNMGASIKICEVCCFTYILFGSGMASWRTRNLQCLEHFEQLKVGQCPSDVAPDAAVQDEARDIADTDRADVRMVNG